MEKKIFLSLVLFLFVGNVFAQNLFPLNVGDKYVYNKYITGQYSGRVVYRVVSSQVLDDKTYYTHTLYYNALLRYDSLSGLLFARDENSNCIGNLHERVVDSLSANLGDSIRYCILPKSKCVFKQQINMFNTMVWAVKFTSVFGPFPSTNNYYLGYGSPASYGDGINSYHLIGGNIAGVPFGDTSLVNIQTISNIVPDKYSLSQNYPNPFNPSTRINYELRNANYVSLKVFDLLGKEVAQLVNEKQSAGSYAVDFNSSEFSLPSGIYFYTLNAGEFTETRKMVLVK